jgi:ferritin
MIHEKMAKALNKQINAELYSAYLYNSMTAYFSTLNLEGFVNWMKVQSMEELYHAQKFFNFMLDRSGRVVLEAIAKPKTDWKSPLAAFQDANKHEQLVTSLINDLVTLSLELKDHASNAMLQWFVTEQVEEELNTDNVVQRLKLVGNSGDGLLRVDQELAVRALTIPPDVRIVIAPAAAGAAP